MFLFKLRRVCTCEFCPFIPPYNKQMAVKMGLYYLFSQICQCTTFEVPSMLICFKQWHLIYCIFICFSFFDCHTYNAYYGYHQFLQKSCFSFLTIVITIHICILHCIYLVDAFIQSDKHITNSST